MEIPAIGLLILTCVTAYKPVVIYDPGKLFTFLTDTGSIEYVSDPILAAQIQQDARSIDGNWVFLKHATEDRSYEYADILPKWGQFNQIYRGNQNHTRNNYAESQVTILNDIDGVWSENMTRGVMRGRPYDLTGRLVSGVINRNGYILHNTQNTFAQFNLDPNCTICNDTNCFHTNDDTVLFTIEANQRFSASCGNGEMLFLYLRVDKKPTLVEHPGYKIIRLQVGTNVEKYFPEKNEVVTPKYIAYHYTDHIYNRNLGFYSNVNPVTEMFGRTTFDRKKRDVETVDEDFDADYNFAPIGSFALDTAAFVQVLVQLREAASHTNSLKDTINKNNDLLEADSREQNVDISKNAYEIAINKLWIYNVQYKANLLSRSVDILQTKTYALYASMTRVKATTLLVLNQALEPQEYNGTQRELALQEKCNGTLKEISHRTSYSLAFCKDGLFFSNSSNVTYEELGDIAATLKGFWYILNKDSLKGPYLELTINTASKQVFISAESTSKEVLETLKTDTKEDVISKCKRLKYTCAWIDGLDYGDSAFTYNPNNEELIKTLKNLGIESFNIRRQGNKYEIECLEPRVVPVNSTGDKMNTTVKLTEDGKPICNLPADIKDLVKRAQAAEQRRLTLTDVRFAKDDNWLGLYDVASDAFDFVKNSASDIIDVVKDVGSFVKGPWLLGNIMSLVAAGATVFLTLLFFYLACKFLRRPV